MITLSNFDVIKDNGDGCGNILSYYGENTGYIYNIIPRMNHFAIVIDDLDENGDAYCKAVYESSSVSSAIAIVEAMENGEEV